MLIGEGNEPRKLFHTPTSKRHCAIVATYRWGVAAAAGSGFTCGVGVGVGTDADADAAIGVGATGGWLVHAVVA